MKRLLACLPVVMLATACGSSGGATKTVTVTRTVTAPATSAATDPGTGNASSSSSVGAAPDACSLLTQAEAEAIAGTPLMKPEGAGPGSGAPSVMCQYTGPSTGPTAQVAVFVGDGAKQQLHIDRDNLGHHFTTVPGIGDQCLQEDNFIFVQKNGLWASINLVRLNDAKDNVVPLQTGIKQVADRLP